MSLTRFAEGFTSGLSTGADFGESLLKGRTAAAVQDANEIYSEMQNMAPTPGTSAGIPDGDGAGAGPATGYSGEDWNSVKTRYTQALQKVSDPQVLDAMMDRMADLEKSKVMEYGRMALAAIKSGDMDTAQNYLAGVSYYTDPGVTPTVKVTDDGTVLVANPEGNPMVLRPENLEDFLHQFVDFKDYRELAFDRETHKDLMEYRERARLDSVANDAARLALEERRINAGAAVDAARLAKIEQEMAQADAKFKAGATKDKLDQFNSQVEEANTYVNDYLKDPGAFDDNGDDTIDPLIANTQGAVAELSEEGQALVDRSSRVQQVLDAGSAEETADLRNRQAVIRRTLSNPEIALDFQTLISGLAAGENSDMSGSQIGAVALSSILSDGTKYEPFFDRENGLLVIQNAAGAKDYYSIGPSHHESMARMFDPVPAEQQQQQPPGPNPPPQTAIPPEAGP